MADFPWTFPVTLNDGSSVSGAVLYFSSQPAVASSGATGGVISYGTGAMSAESVESDITATATISDIHAMLEAVHTAATAAASVVDTYKIPGAEISEALLSAATATATMADTQQMVAAVTALAQSGASATTIATMLEAITSTAESASSVSEGVVHTIFESLQSAATASTNMLELLQIVDAVTSMATASTSLDDVSLYLSNLISSATTTSTISDRFSAKDVNVSTVEVVAMGNDVLRPMGSLPDRFTIAHTTYQPMAGYSISEPIIISGMTIPGIISVSGGEYSLNGGEFTLEPGNVTGGDELRCRVSTPDSYGSNVTMLVSIEGITATFTATTLPRPVGSMTPVEVLDMVQGLFPTMYLDQVMLNSLLVKALGVYQDHAGPYDTMTVADGSTVALPTNFLSLAAISDVRGRWHDSIVRNDTLTVRETYLSVRPYTVHYFCALRSMVLNRDVLPKDAVGPIMSYLEALIRVANTDRERQVMLSAGITVELPSREELMQRLDAEMESLEESRSMLPMATVY